MYGSLRRITLRTQRVLAIVTSPTIMLCSGFIVEPLLDGHWAEVPNVLRLATMPAACEGLVCRNVEQHLGVAFGAFGVEQGLRLTPGLKLRIDEMIIREILLTLPIAENHVGLIHSRALARAF